MTSKNILNFRIFFNEFVDNQKLFFHLEYEKEEEDSMLNNRN